MSFRATMSKGLKKLADMLSPQNKIQTLLQNSTFQSFPMLSEIQKWERMYKGDVPWKIPSEGLYTLNLPSVISAHIARLVTLDMKASISAQSATKEGEPDENSFECAKFLNTSFQPLVNNLRKIIEYAAALGSVALKPVPVWNGINWRIDIDYVLAGRFSPISYDSTGNITACAFIDYTTYNNNRYIRLEYHEFRAGKYTIRNEIYSHGMISNDMLITGERVSITSVPRWSDLTEEMTFSNVEEPLFAILNMPFANTIDPLSPVGISIFARAESLIEQTDRMYSQLIWEMNSGARALYVHYNAFQSEETEPGQGFERNSLAFRRFYRMVETPTSEGAGLFQEWSPKLRDADYINTMNVFLRAVEDTCALSRGTISAPTHATQLGAKTATELKMQMHVTHSTVANIRMQLRVALDRIAKAMYVWTQVQDENGSKLYDMCPEGLWAVNCEFDDSLITDTALQFVEMMQMLEKGIITSEMQLQWYFGLSVEDAKKVYEEAQAQITNRLDAAAKLSLVPPGRGALEPSNLANSGDNGGVQHNANS